MTVTRTWTARLVRVAGLATIFVLGPPMLAAGCSETSPPAAAIDGGSSPEAAAIDATPPDGRLFDATPSDAGRCAMPANPARCSGSDGQFVFVPLPSCDPSTRDASAYEAGDAIADANDPCANVTAQSISFTANECSAFAKEEAGGFVSFAGGRQAPTLTAPSDGDALTSDAWSIFAWSKGMTAQLGPLERAAEWLEPTAHAYVPLAGDGYVLEFTQGCTEVLRVMAADTYWAPDPAAWARLVATEGPVVVRVYWAKYANGGIAGHPVASAPITITMKK